MGWKVKIMSPQRRVLEENFEYFRHENFSQRNKGETEYNTSTWRSPPVGTL